MQAEYAQWSICIYKDNLKVKGLPGYVLFRCTLSVSTPFDKSAVLESIASCEVTFLPVHQYLK